MEQRTSLPWRQRICYGVGHSLNNLVASMWSSYLIVYLQLVLGFSPNFAGIVLLVGQVTEAVATPLMGYETSNCKGSGMCKKYGRRKSIHLFGTLCVVLSYPFLFSVCPGCKYASQTALTIMFIPMVIILHFGWASVQVAHLSLIPVLTPYERERDFLNVLRYAVNVLSDIGCYVIVWSVFVLTREENCAHHLIDMGYADKFTIIVVITLVVGLFFTVVFHIGVKEKSFIPAQSEEERTAVENKPPFPEPPPLYNLSWTGWMRERNFYSVGLLYMCTRLFQNTSCVFMPLYLQEYLMANDDFIAKVPLVMNVSGLVVSCLMPKLFKIFSKKVTFLFGVALGLGASIWIFFGDHSDFYCYNGIYIVGIMMGATTSMLVVTALSFIHDLIGTSVESGGFVYGCMTFWDKMSNGIIAMIIQHLHYEYCTNCDWFYKGVLSYCLGGIIIACTAILLTIPQPKYLGKRHSPHNGAVLSTNIPSLPDPNEKQPLLQKCSSTLNESYSKTPNVF